MKSLLGACFIYQVSGHGYISRPPAQYYDGVSKTKYNTLTDESMDPSFAGIKWNDNPDNNLKSFNEAFNKSKFTSLKNMFDVANVDCGNSRIDISPIDVSNMDSMSWQNDEEKQGFIKSHSGPCEVWLDDKIALRNSDCRSMYPDYPAVIPINYSLCGSRCLLEFYWIAVHEPKWQMYKQCVPLIRSVSSPPSNDVSQSNLAYSTTIKNGVCTCQVLA